MQKVEAAVGREAMRTEQDSASGGPQEQHVMFDTVQNLHQHSVRTVASMEYVLLVSVSFSLLTLLS